MSEVVTAFGDRTPGRTWITEGLHCATYHGPYSNLNGYVQLPALHPDRVIAEIAESMPGTPFLLPSGEVEISEPQGYDYVPALVHGGWTYGPDDEGWIGWDTSHCGDIWPMDYRVAHLDQRFGPEFIPVLEMMFAPNAWPGGDYAIRWSADLVTEETSRAAAELAQGARPSGAPYGVVR